MARGGIYDQLGGGFARYSVDAEWVVPHFEKMLYDNAQLVGLYARWGGPLGERIAAGTADFLLRELRTSEGGFASALDADSEGVEGKFYAWTPAELVEVLGPDHGAWAAQVFEVTEAGTFEHGVVDAAAAAPIPRGRARCGWSTCGSGCSRPARPGCGPSATTRSWPPGTAWPSAGSATPVACSAVPEYVDAALDAGATAGRPARRRRRLLRVSRDGVVGRHAGRAGGPRLRGLGFLSLAQATGDVAWLDRRTALLDAALRTSGPTTAASSTPPTTPRRWSRGRATPATTPARRACRRWSTRWSRAALTGEGRYRTAAEEALATVAGLAERAPRFAGWSLAAAVTMLDGPLEVAVVGPAGAERDALERVARAARRVRWSWSASPTPASRCSTGGSPSTAARRRTCAVASCASAR